MKRYGVLVSVLICAGSWGTPAVAPQAPASVEGVGRGSEQLRPFEVQDYSFAFDVLLGAGDLQRAFLVAQKAVQSLPQDRQWRRKLAKVSTWLARPQVAAEQWLALFAMGDHAADTLNNVMLLAPLADQPLVALQAWAVFARERELTPDQWQTIFVLYEAAAEPAAGAQFFEAAFARRQQPLLLDYAARLAENAGDDVGAERLYRQRADLPPFSLDSVLRLVVLQIRRNDLAGALASLKRHADQVPEAEGEFWQLLGQVAWTQNDTASSLQGYERFTQTKQATAADWVRLVTLVRAQHPQQAADLALQAFRRYGAIDQLLTALSIYTEQGDQAAQARVLAALGERAKLLANTEPRFLLWRAQFYQRQKKSDLAWADLRLLLQRQPGDVDVLQSSLWLLIDDHRLNDLPKLMRANAALAAKEPRLWGAYAAGNQALERHRDAVRWYARMVRANSADPLTLLNYADALERIGQTGMADRLRRHAWLQLKASPPPSVALLAKGASAELLALARLSLLNQPGDAGQALIQRLTGQLRALPQAQQDEQALLLVLGWALMKEQFVNARTWLLRNYAWQTQRAAPLWAESQVALQLQDSTTMARLLSRQADALPIYNRYDIAYALGHVQQAQVIAFSGMSAQDDEPLYDRYRQHVPQQSNYVQIGSAVNHGSELTSHSQQVQLGLVLTPRVQLHLAGQWASLSTNSPTLATITPSTDRLGQLALRWRDERGQSQLELSNHGALATVLGGRFSRSAVYASRWTLDAGVDYRLPSTLSEPMQVAGQESSVHGSVNYTLGRREYVRFGARWSEYATQLDDRLGQGRLLDLEAGYRIRSDYPDWRARVYVSNQSLTRANTLSEPQQKRLSSALAAQLLQSQSNATAYFIPASSTSVGACLAVGDQLTGQALQTDYSRGWRPFGEVCLNHNTVSGSGATAILGMAGTLSGEDHVRLEYEGSSATTSNSVPVNRLTLRYRHYF